MTSQRVSRPAILRRLPIDRHAVCEASAGTGKTFALEHLVVELLLAADVTLDRILVVTFTEKATHELRSRVRAKLVELLSPAAPEPSRAELEEGDYWTIDEVSRERLERALQTFDSATITTIHAFCQRVLRENAFAGGRLFQEQQVDGREAFGRAMRETLRREMVRGGERTPWLEAALRAGWSIGRVEKLLWDCVQSRGDLRPTFDVRALDRAVAAFPAEDARSVDLQAEIRGWGEHTRTAKAIVDRVRDIAHAVAGARSTPAYVAAAENIKFDYLLTHLPSPKSKPGAASRVCDGALSLARHTPTFPAGLAQALLAPVCDDLARRKREAGLYDFDDMLAHVDQALRGPRGPTLARAMRERWRYVLIDEFQDTDETQWSIFRRAFFERGEPPSVVYLVGDPKQSIYRFRGADVHTYLRARDEILAASGARITLDQNYRATAALVAATNLLFDQAAASPVFSGSLEYQPVRCGRPDRNLVDGDGRPLPPVHAFRVRGGADGSTLSALCIRVADEIRTVVDPARPFRLDGIALGYGDVFVLTRNAREGRAVAAALRPASVPYAFFKQDGLFQTNEAREVRSLLLAVDDPGDRSRRLAAWLTPFFGLPLIAIERARDVPGSHPLVARLHAWKALAEARQWGRLFESVIGDSGIVRRELFFGEGERELTNYCHILELLLEHAHRSHATLRDLVYALSALIEKTRMPLELEGNVQRLESERRAVQIMTIHKSKGLEAPIVFLVGGFAQPRADDVRVYHEGGHRLAWVGRVPAGAVDTKVKAEEREEDQRLMYVALTRAKGRLYLPLAVSDGGPGDERGRHEPRSLRGAYAVINRRLAQLAASGDASISIEDLVAGAKPRDASAHGHRVEPWRPAVTLLKKEEEAGKYAALRRAHAGAFTTSYTRMKADHGRGLPAPLASEIVTNADDVADVVDDLAATPQRGGRALGVFLHDVLERVALSTFGAGAGAVSFNDWRAAPAVSSLFDEAVAAHHVDRAGRETAETLVWAAYTTAVDLPGGGRVDRIASAHRVAREMAFVFAIAPAEPVATESAPGATVSGPSAGRLPVAGHVRGSIDLVFEHRGLVYFVDWKSDSLGSYSLDALDRHVRAQYEMQAQLYALATTKLLGTRTREEHDARFGGVIYCFLRGLNAAGHGVWSARPGWDQMVRWDADLRAARRQGPRD